MTEATRQPPLRAAVQGPARDLFSWADFSTEIVLITDCTMPLTQICRGFGFIEQAPNSQRSLLLLLLLLSF